MALPLYLAQTRAEMAGNPSPPPCFAYMACHFSPSSPGLSNLPDSLPPGGILVLDDSTPFDGHDPDFILKQLTDLIGRYNCESLLLDFQRPGCDSLRELPKLLCSSLPCPVGVSELYAQGLRCPVFLPPVPPDRPLADYLAPWRSREVWLEAALEGLTLTLTENGCTATSLFGFPDEGLKHDKLHCHYAVESPAVFHLWRTPEDLDGLLIEATALGVTKAVGLWQELGRKMIVYGSTFS